MWYPITVYWTVFSVHSSRVECHYTVSLLILLSIPYFIMVISSITQIVMSMATLHLSAFWNYVILVLQSINSRDGSSTVPYFTILDLTCYHRTPSCQICELNWDILPGSSGLCNWLSLWCLRRGLTTCLPFLEVGFQWPLVCKFDITE